MEDKLPCLQILGEMAVALYAAIVLGGGSQDLVSCSYEQHRADVSCE